jgi:hypothetical protein
MQDAIELALEGCTRHSSNCEIVAKAARTGVKFDSVAEQLGRQWMQDNLPTASKSQVTCSPEMYPLLG